MVSDVSPSTTSFDTNLTQGDTYFDDAILVFGNGAANAGIGLPVSAYLNTGGNFSFAVPDDWPVTPVDGDDFNIYAFHVHPVSQIQAGLATEDKQDIILSAANMNAIADHILRRSSALARASADGDAVAFRSLLGTISKLTNKVGFVGTDLVIREEDDSTVFGTQSATTDAAAELVTDLDTV